MTPSKDEMELVEQARTLTRDLNNLLSSLARHGVEVEVRAITGNYLNGVPLTMLNSYFRKRL